MGINCDSFREVVRIRTWTLFSVAIKAPELPIEFIQYCVRLYSFAARQLAFSHKHCILPSCITNDSCHIPYLLLWLWQQTYYSPISHPTLCWLLGNSTSTTLLNSTKVSKSTSQLTHQVFPRNTLHNPPSKFSAITHWVVGNSCYQRFVVFATSNPSCHWGCKKRLISEIMSNRWHHILAREIMW